MDLPDKIYRYTDRFGTDRDMIFRRGEYAMDNSTYIAMYCRSDDDDYFEWEDYGDATVFVVPQESRYRVCLDTNNLGDAILNWMVEQGLAVDTGIREASGLCEYPVVDLLPEWLDSLYSLADE